MGQHPHQIDGRRPIDHHRLGIPQMAGGVAPGLAAFGGQHSPKGAKASCVASALESFSYKPFLSASAAPCRAPVLREAAGLWASRFSSTTLSTNAAISRQPLAKVWHCRTCASGQRHWQSSAAAAPPVPHPPRGPCRRLDGRRPAQRSAATAAYRWKPLEDLALLRWEVIRIPGNTAQDTGEHISHNRDFQRVDARNTWLPGHWSRGNRSRGRKRCIS